MKYLKLLILLITSNTFEANVQDIVQCCKYRKCTMVSTEQYSKFILKFIEWTENINNLRNAFGIIIANFTK